MTSSNTGPPQRNTDCELNLPCMELPTRRGYNYGNYCYVDSGEEKGVLVVAVDRRSFVRCRWTGYTRAFKIPLNLDLYISLWFMKRKFARDGR